jgi:hypothetical protein
MGGLPVGLSSVLALPLSPTVNGVGLQAPGSGPSSTARKPESGILLCRRQHLFDDRANVVIGRSVVDDADAEADRASDAGIRQPHPTSAIHPAEDFLIAVVQRLSTRTRPAEAGGTQLDRSEQLERRLGLDQVCEQGRLPEVLADRSSERSEPVVPK